MRFAVSTTSVVGQYVGNDQRVGVGGESRQGILLIVEIAGKYDALLANIDPPGKARGTAMVDRDS